jgi:hypothetical protein
MLNLTRDMMLLLVDGREYRVAFMRESDGGFDVVDRFMAPDDDGANSYAEQYYAGQEWYVLDRDGNNINGGDQT